MKGGVGAHVIVGLVGPAHVAMDVLREGPFTTVTVEGGPVTLATVSILMKKMHLGALLCETRGTL